MKKQIRLLTNENRLLKEKYERLTMKLDRLNKEKKAEKKEKKEKPVKAEVVDFKKKFFDSL